MIIDAHTHTLRRPKLVPSHRAGGLSFLSAQELVALMDDLGIDKSVILQTHIEPQSPGELISIYEDYPGRFILFYNIDPRQNRRADMITADGFRYMLEQYKEWGCKGLGEITARVYWDDPRWLQLVQACGKVGFPITFHTTTSDCDSYGLVDDMGFPRFEKVLGQFPEVIFIGHSQAFWSEISADITPEEKNGYPKGPVIAGGRIPELMRRAAESIAMQ